MPFLKLERNVSYRWIEIAGASVLVVIGSVLRETTERNGDYASQDTYFLENWCCSGLRSRPGFIVASALRGLLRALS